MTPGAPCKAKAPAPDDITAASEGACQRFAPPAGRNNQTGTPPAFQLFAGDGEHGHRPASINRLHDSRSR